MGTFAEMSGVIGRNADQVIEALNVLAANEGCELKPVAVKEIGSEHLAVVNAEKGTTIFYPSGFVGEEQSRFLSKHLNATVFWLMIYDGDFWNYTLFDRGEERDKFITDPDYFEKVSQSEKLAQTGNADIVAKYVPGLDPEQIRNYLVHLSSDDQRYLEAKAYPDDESKFGEDWQLTDFMRKLGLPYIYDSENKLQGELFLWIDPNAPAPIKKPPKPWWKFWQIGLRALPRRANRARKLVWLAPTNQDYLP